jgi:hypothetical protein
MQKFNIVQFEEVTSIINLYDKDPAAIMEWVKKGATPANITNKAKELWKSSTGLAIVQKKL